MTRKIKVIGLAIVAVVAMSMGATSAQAFEMHVTTQGSATLTGQQTQEFVLTTDAGTVKCSTVTFEGTVQGQGPQITNQHSTLTPTLSSCTAFGLAAAIQMNGCKFTITSKSAAGVTAVGGRTAYVDITGCTAGKQITVSAAGGSCVFTAPEQHHVSHAVFSDNGPGGTSTEDIDAQLTLTGITYELHGAFCPGGGATGLRTNGTTIGKATFKAFVDAGVEQVTEHGHQFSKSKEGAQVGLRST